MFKKRKLISIMLTISMMLTLFPFAAFAEEGQTGAEQTQQEQNTPATQLPEAGEDGVITLEKDVELSETHEFSQDVTLNLNGHNITAKDKRALWVKADTLTIEGQGTITSVKPENGKLEDSSSVIRVGDSGDAAKLVLGKDVTVEAPATYGVTVFGTNSSLEATINGTIHSVVSPALAGNGSSNLTATTITLGNTAKLTADQAIAIFHPQAGTMNVNGATIIGTGGIEMKAGTLNVAEGSTITATAEKTAHQVNGNGTSTDGYAIVAVDTNGGYVGKVVVNVTGGTVTGPVDKVVDKAPAADKKGSITVSGGTFNQDVTEFLADQKGQNADGSIGELNATNAVAKIGDIYYGSFSAAIAAANAANDGAVIEVLKDVTVPSAQYVLNKKITLKSTNKANITMTVSALGAKPADNKAIDILKGAGLTLDGVVLTIKGNKNAAGNYDGTGIDLNGSVEETVKGANLTLKNGAIINLTELERATIASAVGASKENKVKNQSTLNMEPGTQLNMTKIDGNCANGGNWTLDNATMKIDGCGSHGLSAHEIIAKNNSDITVNNAGLVGVTAKDLIVESGSDVTVSNSGKNLPKALWNDPSKEYTNVVEMQDGGKFVVKDSIVTLANNKNKKEEVLDKIFVNDAKTDIQGSKIDAELVYAETDATKNQIHVEYIVDGKVYFAITDEVGSNGKVEFTEPADPTLSGYTFRYWDYPSNVTVSGDKVYLTPVKDQNTYTFVAKFSKNSSTPSVTEYSVTVKKTDNGSASVSPKRAEAGDKVTINVDPDKGYVVDAVVVTDKDGDKITVTKKSDTKYTFTMPKSRVDVKVTFKAEQTEPEQPSDMPFVDVVKDAWYYPAVEYVHNNELMNGTNGGLTFEPNVNLNRAMMAAVLYNMEGGPDCDKSGLFSDVADGMWYTEAINWAASNNIVSGMPDGTYAPNQALTREQMASVLYRYAEYKGIKTDARADLGKFTDGSTTSAWAQDVVQWAVAEKLMSGNGNELQPKGTASRAQVATVLMNYCENVAK